MSTADASPEKTSSTGPTWAGPTWAGPTWAGPTWTGPTRTGPTWSVRLGEPILLDLPVFLRAALAVDGLADRVTPAAALALPGGYAVQATRVQTRSSEEVPETRAHLPTWLSPLAAELARFAGASLAGWQLVWRGGPPFAPSWGASTDVAAWVALVALSASIAGRPQSPLRIAQAARALAARAGLDAPLSLYLAAARGGVVHTQPDLLGEEEAELPPRLLQRLGHLINAAFLLFPSRTSQPGPTPAWLRAAGLYHLGSAALRGQPAHLVLCHDEAVRLAREALPRSAFTGEESGEAVDVFLPMPRPRPAAAWLRTSCRDQGWQCLPVRLAWAPARLVVGQPIPDAAGSL